MLTAGKDCWQPGKIGWLPGKFGWLPGKFGWLAWKSVSYNLIRQHGCGWWDFLWVHCRVISQLHIERWAVSRIWPLVRFPTSQCRSNISSFSLVSPSEGTSSIWGAFVYRTRASVFKLVERLCRFRRLCYRTRFLTSITLRRYKISFRRLCLQDASFRETERNIANWCVSPKLITTSLSLPFSLRYLFELWRQMSYQLNDPCALGLGIFFDLFVRQKLTSILCFLFSLSRTTWVITE